MEPANLNTIGLMGGMSSAATAAYYEIINQKVKTVKGGHNIAEIIICSVNFAALSSIFERKLGRKRRTTWWKKQDASSRQGWVVSF